MSLKGQLTAELIPLNKDQCELADLLLQAGVIKVTARRPGAKHYNPQLHVDMRAERDGGPLTTEINKLIKKHVSQTLFGRWTRFDRVATCGRTTPLTDLVSEIGNNHCRLTLCRASGGTPSGGISGDFHPAKENYGGDRVLLIDDQMDGQLRNAATVILNAQLRLYGILQLIDLDRVNIEKLQHDVNHDRRGSKYEDPAITVLTVLPLDSLLEHYRSTGQITQEQYDKLRIA